MSWLIARRSWRRLGGLPCAAALATAILFGLTPAHGQPAAPKNHALLVGVNGPQNSIEGIPVLKYAVNDAKALEEALSDSLYDIVRLPQAHASRRMIVGELLRLARETREQDSVLIYFAGHGVRHQPGTRKHVYWLTYDTTLATLEFDALRLSHALDYIADIKAKRKLVILDHCHSGDVEVVEAALGDSSRAGEGGLRVRKRGVLKVHDFGGPLDQVKTREAEGLVLLAAATDKAYEYQTLEHGLFTHLLLKALSSSEADDDSNGKLTVGELRNYLAEMVGPLAENEGVVQTHVDVVKGTNLDWNLADVGDGAERLQRLLGQLEAFGNLDGSVATRCFIAVGNVAAGTDASPNDAKIVEKLKEIDAIGTGVDWQTKGVRLSVFVSALEGSP